MSRQTNKLRFTQGIGMYVYLRTIESKIKLLQENMYLNTSIAILQVLFI